MKFLNLLLILLVAVFLVTGCSEDNNSTGPDDGEVILYINEFMSHNEMSYAGDYDEYPDWIELYNAGDNAVDIAGWYLTDDLEDLTQSMIPDTNPGLTTIQPGGYLVLIADSQANPGVLHLAFKLSDDEDFALVDPDGVTIIDQHNTGVLADDISEGRLPDGGENWTYFGEGYTTMPTPGSSNGSGETPMAMFVINEFMASNSYTYADEFGDFDDWIEIYNAGNIPGDIGGFFITDDLDELDTWQIPDTDPDLTTILPGQHLILWADKEPEQGVLHVDIKLSGDGENIVLTDVDGTTVLDSYTFEAQDSDISMGLLPDGSDEWTFFGDGYDTSPTPGAENGSGDAPQAILYINEFLASNELTNTDENGDPDDWIEIFNGGNATIDIGGLYITDDLEELNSWQIPDTDPDLTTIAPRGYLILWADKEPDQGVLHVDIKLSADGEAIGLVESDGTTIIDSYIFDAQTVDVSEGRMPDGGDTWQFFDTPTPGMPNE